MLLSAVESTPNEKIKIYYVHGSEFSLALQQQIRELFSPYEARVHLNFPLVPDEWVTGLPLFDHMKAGSIPPVMWYRVFLPMLAPEESRILYLDSDTLVLDHLGSLWAADIADKPLAAVTNPFFGGDIANNTWPLRLGLPAIDAYFNTGVMLLNLDYFRAHDLTNKVLEHGRKNARFIRFGDQDSMCALLHAERVPLSPRWNLMRTIMLSTVSKTVFSDDVLRNACRHPGIVHFEGTIKPWVDPSRHPYGRKYLHYARRLPWPVAAPSLNLRDIENILIRRRWLRLWAWTQRLRKLFSK